MRTAKIGPDLRLLLMQMKVTGPVSFIHFSFPVEAGQLTWSLFFIDFHWVSFAM